MGQPPDRSPPAQHTCKSHSLASAPRLHRHRNRPCGESGSTSVATLRRSPAPPPLRLGSLGPAPRPPGTSTRHPLFPFYRASTSPPAVPPPTSTLRPPHRSTRSAHCLRPPVSLASHQPRLAPSALALPRFYPLHPPCRASSAPHTASTPPTRTDQRPHDTLLPSPPPSFSSALCFVASLFPHTSGARTKPRRRRAGLGPAFPLSHRHRVATSALRPTLFPQPSAPPLSRPTFRYLNPTTAALFPSSFRPSQPPASRCSHTPLPHTHLLYADPRRSS